MSSLEISMPFGRNTIVSHREALYLNSAVNESLFFFFFPFLFPFFWSLKLNLALVALKVCDIVLIE